MATYTTPTTTRDATNTANLNFWAFDPAAFNIEFTTGSDITTGQILWEVGGSGFGTALGVNGGDLEVYCGNTVALQTSYAITANTSYHATLIVDFVADELRLYVSTTGTAVAADLVSTVTFTENRWAGSDATGVGYARNTCRAPYTGSFLGTINSPLRFWDTNDILDTYEVLQVSATLAAQEVGADVFNAVASVAIIGNLATQEVGQDTFAGMAFIGMPSARRFSFPNEGQGGNVTTQARPAIISQARTGVILSQSNGGQILDHARSGHIVGA